jgi:enoyl-CoA hydratase
MMEGDFVEGVRAAVVDKDRKPMWNPGGLDEVTSERVNSFFSEAGLPNVGQSDWFS